MDYVMDERVVEEGLKMICNKCIIGINKSMTIIKTHHSKNLDQNIVNMHPNVWKVTSHMNLLDNVIALVMNGRHLKKRNIEISF